MQFTSLAPIAGTNLKQNFSSSVKRIDFGASLGFFFHSNLAANFPVRASIIKKFG